MRLCRIGPEAAPRPPSTSIPTSSRWPPPPSLTARPAARPSASRPRTTSSRCSATSACTRPPPGWPARPNPPGAIPIAQAELLVPVAKPNKLFCLAGNYAEHVKEGGGTPAERAETFPYVFMKPPSTTLTHPNRPVAASRRPPRTPSTGSWSWPSSSAASARTSPRPTPSSTSPGTRSSTTCRSAATGRTRTGSSARRTSFFDWLHGKWFDTFCPCGPCAVSADAVPDPQNLTLELTVNDEVKQKGTTAQMVFPVAAVIEFISKMVTLEPGDLISTGTPAGVGNSDRNVPEGRGRDEGDDPGDRHAGDAGGGGEMSVGGEVVI